MAVIGLLILALVAWRVLRKRAQEEQGRRIAAVSLVRTLREPLLRQGREYHRLYAITTPIRSLLAGDEFPFRTPQRRVYLECLASKEAPLEGPTDTSAWVRDLVLMGPAKHELADLAFAVEFLCPAWTWDREKRPDSRPWSALSGLLTGDLVSLIKARDAFFLAHHLDDSLRMDPWSIACGLDFAQQCPGFYETIAVKLRHQKERLGDFNGTHGVEIDRLEGEIHRLAHEVGLAVEGCTERGEGVSPGPKLRWSPIWAVCEECGDMTRREPRVRDECFHCERLEWMASLTGVAGLANETRDMLREMYADDEE